MINDSFTSSYASSSLNQPVKSRLFHFVRNNPEKSQNSKLIFPTHSGVDFSQQNFIQVDMKALKPKLSPKKLMEDPKFLISLQRRKKRITSGLQPDNFPEQTKIILQKNRKDSSALSKKSVKSNVIKKKDQIYKKQQKYVANNNSQNQSKALYINFNLHHLLKRKTNFDMNNNKNNVKGSSEAFYSTYFGEINSSRPIHSSHSFRLLSKKPVRISASALTHRRGKSLSS